MRGKNFDVKYESKFFYETKFLEFSYIYRNIFLYYRNYFQKKFYLRKQKLSKLQKTIPNKIRTKLNHILTDILDTAAHTFFSIKLICNRKKQTHS